MSKSLLTARQLASFVADGFLVFPGLIPEPVNAAVMAEFAAERHGDCGYRGERFADRYRGTALGEMVRLPPLVAIIASLVGPDPIFDHHCLHVQPPRSGPGGWHQDAVIDTTADFDLQLLYFPHQTPREMGGTMLLPGSHFRRVNVFEVMRYQNFIGQQPMVCPAGTVVAVHHGMWHTAQPNRTDRPRLMFKIRLAASVPQVRLFDTADLHDPEVGAILSREHAWPGTDSRLELIHRARLWRRLSDDPQFDIGYYLGRLENDPRQAVPAAARAWLGTPVRQEALQAAR